jgi:hypothetical protein
MGWMSWVRFECNIRCDIDPENCISERLYKTMADILVKEGYADAGYRYLSVDDCWMSRTRDRNGRLQADPDRFPSGIRALADYMHARGLKLGMYLDIGNLTCANYPGTKNNMGRDAQIMAEWRVDKIKFDGCNANLQDYELGYPAFGQYLNATGWPMLYSCQWPMYARYYGGKVDYPAIAKTCNMFRALTDVYFTYQSVRSMVDYYASDPYNFSRVAGPGAWNDPDQLVLGNFGLSHDQERFHIAMWAMMAAPLIMSNDLRKMPPSSKALLLNRNIIALNQDPLGIQGRMVLQNEMICVWTRPITPVGSYAIAFLNYAKSGGPKLIAFTLGGIPNISRMVSYNVYEVFDNRFIGFFKPTETIRFYVNPSGIYLIKAVPA